MGTFTPADELLNEAVYRQFAAKRQPNGWSRRPQMDNFYNLMKIEKHTGIPIQGSRVIDVGCGTGDLSKELRKKGVKDYLGMDIRESAIDAAREKYPKEIFLQADFLEAMIEGQFDYAFCSGAMNLKIKDNYAFFEEMIKKMWAASAIGIAFNFLSDRDFHKHELIFDYGPERAKKICAKISGSACYIEHEKYSLFTGPEITAYIFRQKES